MKGIPNINMALLLAYSEFSLGSEREKSQELTKSAASALKFDKDLANADWNMVEKAIILQNPYALSQEEVTEHPKVRCLDCNKEIDETLNIEAIELANRRLLSAQIVYEC